MYNQESLKFGILVLVPFLLHFISPLYADDAAKGRVLLTMERGEIGNAFHLYSHYRQEHGDDEHLLTQLALKLIQKGFRENDESALLAIFGAGISMHEAALPLFAEALKSPLPQHQIVALHFLGLSRDRQADKILILSQGSPYLEVRLQGAIMLAQHGDPQAIEIAETLMAKAPDEARVLFPPLFAAIGGERGRDALRRMMHHTNVDVRVSAVLSAAEHGREDLLPQIRSLAIHPNPSQKEACAFALGRLGDESSIPLLKKLLQRPQNNVKVAAALALHSFNQPEGKKTLIDLALRWDPMAIISLGKVAGAEDILIAIASKGNDEQKCNALLALLQRHDTRCSTGITELLLSGRTDRALVATKSPGGTITYWHPLDSSSAKLANNPAVMERSLQQKEKMLIEALELPEAQFLKIAQEILQHQENALIPALSLLLENHATPQAIKLLQQSQQQLGSPLVRHYALLALCRLNEGEEYDSQLIKWISEHNDHPMIQFRPSIPNDDGYGYTLTPQETSRFLVEAYETIAKRRDPQAIGILLDAIENGNHKNRYVLAGLLLRALE